MMAGATAARELTSGDVTDEFAGERGLIGTGKTLLA